MWARGGAEEQNKHVVDSVTSLPIEGQGGEPRQRIQSVTQTATAPEGEGGTKGHCRRKQGGVHSLLARRAICFHPVPDIRQIVNLKQFMQLVLSGLKEAVAVLHIRLWFWPLSFSVCCPSAFLRMCGSSRRSPSSILASHSRLTKW